MSGSGSSGRIVRGHSAKLTTVDRIGFGILYSSKRQSRLTVRRFLRGDELLLAPARGNRKSRWDAAWRGGGGERLGPGRRRGCGCGAEGERPCEPPRRHCCLCCQGRLRLRSTPRPARDLWTVWYWASFFVSLRPFCHFLPHFCFCWLFQLISGFLSPHLCRFKLLTTAKRLVFRLFL